MDARNVNAYQLAKSANVARSNVFNWRSGKVTPSVEKLISVAEFFGVSLDYLVGCDDVPNRKEEGK